MAPTIQGKQEYLRMVKAKDSQKNKVTGCYRVEPVRGTKSTQEKQELKTTKKENKPTMTKLGRKQKHNELKRTLKQRVVN